MPSSSTTFVFLLFYNRRSFGRGFYLSLIISLIHNDKTYTRIKSNVNRKCKKVLRDTSLDALKLLHKKSKMYNYLFIIKSFNYIHVLILFKKYALLFVKNMPLLE